MNVIAKITCYFEHSVVTLKLRKEYLNTVTYNTPVLLLIEYRNTVWYIERYATSTHTGVRNFQKSLVFRPTLYNSKIYYKYSAIQLWKGKKTANN